MNHSSQYLPSWKRSTRVQLLAPHQVTPKSDPVSESSAQTLLELWQLGAVITAVEPSPVPSHPLGEKVGVSSRFLMAGSHGKHPLSAQ